MAGDRASGSVPRMTKQGDNFVASRFHLVPPVAMAQIGALPDTTADRSIVVNLLRKLPASGPSASTSNAASPLQRACAAERQRGRSVTAPSFRPPSPSRPAGWTTGRPRRGNRSSLSQTWPPAPGQLWPTCRTQPVRLRVAPAPKVRRGLALLTGFCVFWPRGTSGASKSPRRRCSMACGGWKRATGATPNTASRSTPMGSPGCLGVSPSAPSVACGRGLRTRVRAGRPAGSLERHLPSSSPGTPGKRHKRHKRHNPTNHLIRAYAARTLVSVVSGLQGDASEESGPPPTQSPSGPHGR